MKKLIITLIIMAAMFSSLFAKHNQEAEIITQNECTGRKSSTGTSTSMGTIYYRSNTVQRFEILSNADLDLKNLNARVKIIPWSKEYGELEVMKVSSVSEEELSKLVVWIDNSEDVSIGTCCSDGASGAMVSVILKLPENIYAQYMGNDDSEIINIDPIYNYVR